MQADPLPMDTASPFRRAPRAGWMLLAMTALAILAMAHHPQVGRGSGIEAALEQIRQWSQLDRWVHGTLIALLLATATAFLEFVSPYGWTRPTIRAGAVAYGTGVLFMIGAALVSGFVVPDVATLMPQGDPAQLQIDSHLLRFCGILNQACANAAMVAMSAGIVFWSVALLRAAGAARYVGALGCAIGIVPTLALVGGALRLDVHGMQLVVLAQAVWTVAFAWLRIRVKR